MTERCQKEFTGKNSNHNFIIYGGIFAALLGVLYLYRFHLVSIIVSYGLGCVACYYGLTTEVLRHYVEQITCHFLQKSPEKEEIPKKGCNTCGSKDCNRHDPQIYAEPWRGLQIHKQLDQAIEDFYNTILEQFINSWYTKITLQPFFVDELRHQLRYASASLLRRALKINYAKLISERLVPCALRHYSVVTSGARPCLHVAASNRAAELRYLRCVTDALLPYLLRDNEVQNPVFNVLVREIFAGWVLLSLTDVLADPYILNTLIILATGNETMANLPPTPNYKVEFLETFVRQTESVYAQRPRLLRVELEVLVQDPEHFYAFMQHLKTSGTIHVLHFYKDIKSFQTRILNPDLTADEQAYLHREAKELYQRYIAVSLPCVCLPDALERELRDLLDTGVDFVKRLQTSRALYQAAHQSHAMLEKVLMPKFLHSEEFYKLLIGPRVPTGYHKQFTKRPQDKPVKLGNRLRNALRSQTADGQVDPSSLPDDEGMENLDILKYLDSLAAEDSLGDQDLSTYKVVLTHVETRLQPPPRRGPVRVFRVAVRCAPAEVGAGAGAGVGALAGVGARLWTVERTEHDFHLLRAKLQEFHGDRLLANLPLPSRRDNSPLETLRYKYEDFLQRILQITLLQTSELLYLFLTVDTDFSLVVQASTLNVGTDLGNIYQSVAHRLRKEKGQHLESFLRNFLISSDKERYQALKQGTAREVEEGLEVGEHVSAAGAAGAGGAGRAGGARDTRGRTFGDNWGEAPRVVRRDLAPQDRLVGFTHCLMYILLKVIKTRSLISGVVGTVLSAARALVDGALCSALNRRLRVLLSERRLAHLIRLGHGILFSKRSSPRAAAALQRAAAARVRARCGGAAGRALGPGLRRAALAAFDVIQNPLLNKQLVYNLFDLCIVELFPELRSDAPS